MPVYSETLGCIIRTKACETYVKHTIHVYTISSRSGWSKRIHACTHTQKNDIQKPLSRGRERGSFQER